MSAPHRRRPSRLVASTLAASVLAAGCGTDRRTVSLREVRADVLYGDRNKAPAPTVPPGAVPGNAFPGFVQPPPTPPVVEQRLPGAPSTTTATTRKPAACPTAGLLDLPAATIAPVPSRPPTPGAYRYAVTGLVTLAGAASPVPTAQRRVVRPPVDPDGNPGTPTPYRYDVVVEDGSGSTTTTTYQVDLRGVDDGLFIVQTTTTSASGTQAFTPVQPVKVVPFPLAIGDTFTSTGIDPLTLTVLSVRGRVGTVQRIDVCGQLADGYTVEIGEGPPVEAPAPPPIPLVPFPDLGSSLPSSPSSIRSTDRSLTLTGRLVLAPQLGGLVLTDDLSMQGTTGGQAFTSKVSSRLQSLQPDR